MDPHEHLPSEHEHHGHDDPRPDAVSEHIDSWADLALDLLDGSLPAREAEALNAHLAACAACRSTLDDQRGVALLTRAVPAAPVPEGIFEAVRAHLSDSLPGAAGSATAAALEPTGHSGEPRTAGDHTEGGVRAWVRTLIRPRVWLPAAALTLLLGVAVSSYYQSDLRGTDGLRAVDSGETLNAAAPTAEDTLAEDEAKSLQESAGVDTTVAAASTTTTEATMTMATEPMDTAGSGPTSEPPSVQVEALEGGGLMEPPVVWVTVPVPSAEGTDPTPALALLADLLPVTLELRSSGLPAYVALVRILEVDALTAALGISDLRVFALAESETLLPAEISARLAEGPATLPRLQPPTDEMGNSYGGPTDMPPSDSQRVNGFVILVVTLSPQTD
ncbi:MAG: anti-sigma factor family protein [Thermoleophilia bacterium]